jgi:uncharacterized protein YndB with AHSA1/START domain
MSVSTTDRIRKTVVLRAPVERVWRAISDAKQFGSWFGFVFDGDFAAGKRMTGRIVPTTVDASVAKGQEKYAGRAVEITVDRIEPMRVFSYRWHPFALDPSVDYSSEPTTLVVFELAPVAEGTQLTITETGFDSIPSGRRNDAFEANDEGWAAQVHLIEKYLAQNPS